MNINGVELELDFKNKETFEKYKKIVNALRICSNNTNKIPEKNYSKYAFQSCILFINYIWGSGTDKRIFGETATLKEVYEVLNKICDEATRQLNPEALTKM